MSNSTISTKVQADYINQRFEQFHSPLSKEFRLCLDCILRWTHLLRLDKLDQSTTVEAFEVIEHNTKIQSLLLDKLLSWHLTSNELDPKQPLNVDRINQQFEQFKSALSVEFRLSLNCTLCWIHLLRLGRLDQSTTERAFRVIEYNAKLQSLLLNKLLNWYPRQNRLDAVFSELSSGAEL
ncbi:MAG: hypothetical protein KME40_00280 [Komarekiella atlantica HA4396-MV6]|jgi:hypothetical protein|nr:hypothetical protein [Komarekiella atlantica HA4396-MV6]